MIDPVDRGDDPLVDTALTSRAPAAAGQAERPVLSPHTTPAHALVNAEFPRVWRALRRFGLSAADADDAAQQVFLIAVRRLSDIEAGRERAFLYGIAANVAWKTRRARARRREEYADVDDTAHPNPTAEDLLEQRRARELLDRVLDALEHDLRVVFVLHEIEGMPSVEIAHALNIPPGTAASRLRRARQEFARRLARLRAGPGERT